MPLLLRPFGWFLVGLSAAIFGGAAEAAIWRVGTGAGCDTSSVQHAVNLANAPGEHEIRLTKNEIQFEDVSVGNSINSARLVISGGWNRCASTAPSSEKTGIAGLANGNSWGPFQIVRDGPEAPRRQVILRNLFILGEWSTLDPGAELKRDALRVRGGWVELENTLVHHGAPGIHVFDGADVRIDENSAVSENFAPDTSELLGGGISCGRRIDSTSGQNTMVRVRGRVQLNRAVNGAGILARHGCTISLEPGAFVHSNEASGSGGGIYLETGADLFAGGDADSPVRVQGNLADYGGGLYLRSSGTRAQASNIEINDNEALFGGGGVLVNQNAVLQLNRSSSVSCPNAPYCNTLVGNRCNGLNGSALFVAPNGRAEISRAFVNENVGSSSPGPVIRVEGTFSHLRLEGVAFWNNRAVALLEASDGAMVEAGFVTAARNAWLVNGSGDPILQSWVASTSSGAMIDLQASILDDTRGSAGSGNIGRCLLMDDATNMVAGNSIVGQDPRFVSPASGNLHLQSTSPAIDFCDAHFFPIWTDIDLQARGYDSAGNINGIGTLDLGFDEYIGDVGGAREIFDDGFESGNTAAWSAAVD
ncbi:MAG: hypothetical protein AAF481_02455 [Acidobacteriota bacterium]